MSQISLTAPMRSNLLALQNIARQQDIVQNRLATGLKVSSAIDNPSSYYTAASLSNRAADLTALLDAMSQGVQTIKTASDAITSATKFLEQAKAVASQALETTVPAKEWFIEQVGENGAVVETAQELLDAVNAGKETIVIYGKIEFALNERIVLKNGQKLVGTEYYTGLSARNADGSRFSQLSFSSDQDNIKAIQARDDCRVSDLDISHRQLSQSFTESVLQAYGKDIVFADLNIDFQGGQTESHGQSAVSVTGQNGNSVTLSGKINIRASGGSARGIGVFNGGSLLIDKDAEVNVQMGSFSVGGIGMWIWMQGSAVIEGKLQISNATTGIGLAAYTATANYAGNYLSVASGAELYFNNCENLLSSSRTIDSRYANGLSFENGAKIAFDGNYFTCGGYQNINADNIIFNMDAEFILNNAQFSPTGDFYFPEEMITETSADQQKLYNSVLQQYNMLIADSFYKGINLLDGQKLKINFNEDRSSKVEVKGVKADSESLGLTTKEWETVEDIEQSVSELEGAINTLRNYASQYGNYYSIVTTRQDFTENLINVLEEGADKLTLADMNEESANMLALQTSQQLAINSLSLASQAAQSVLKLF